MRIKPYKKLEEWTNAGLITKAQADDIQTYERKHKKFSFYNGLVYVSIFSILLGILSVIAANWHDIPGSIKISVHVLLNLAVGYAAIFFGQKGKELFKEVAVFALMGLTMTLIVLIGQVYQIKGSPADAMILWSLAISPFVLMLAKNKAVLGLWVLGIILTYLAFVAEHLVQASYTTRFYWGFGTWLYLPLLCLGLAKLQWLAARKPALSIVLGRMGLAFLAIGASVGTSSWGLKMFSLLKLDAFILTFLGVLLLGAHALYHKSYRDNEDHKNIFFFALVSFLLMVVPFYFVDMHSNLLSAASFIFYWMFIGWLGHRSDHNLIVTASILFIAIRLLMVYVEVFGTLLTTGFGLIISGIVMLGVIYLARKINTKLTKGASHA